MSHQYLLLASFLFGVLLTSLVSGQETALPPPGSSSGSDDGMPNDTRKILIITLSSAAGMLVLSALLYIWVREARANSRQMPKSLPPGYYGDSSPSATVNEKGKALEAQQTYSHSNISTGSFLPPYPAHSTSSPAPPPAINTQGLAPLTVVVDAPSPTYSPPKTMDTKMMNNSRTRSTTVFNGSSSSSSSSNPTRDRGIVRSNSKLANQVGMGHNFSGDHDGSLHTMATIEQGRNAGFGLGYDVELANQYEQQQNKRASAILMEQVLNTPPRSPSPSQMMFGPGHRSSRESGHGRNLSTASNLSVY